ncbi:FMN reductase [Mesorhizobium sp. L-8-10]|uniref:NADPH-dependent FMN reductase n=1 Tax=unclassified Mesorhizobium TaxID=325217 RepID=UPI0019259A48|nr:MULTISPECIES: NADPH-dependent FMN reductase [unclassified Mesorhizobium]BCH20781.1 FMN reductase [Mesorhizobium sp. L-8-3]BCH28625.1 FMN reductase [Mesorhizobium sp. L-8-10]
MHSILCLCGSLRAASSSKAVVETICQKLAGEAGFTRFDIGSLPHYNADLDPLPDSVAALKNAIAAADGVIIITPEYNYSVPGVLKNAIDWASRPAYASVLKDKPVFIATVSGSAIGGVRAQAHLKNVLGAVLARTFVWQEVAITHSNTKVRDGYLADEATETFLFEALRAFFRSLGRP